MRTIRFSSSLAPLLATLLAIGCSAALPEQESSGQSNVRYGSRVHKLPKMSSGITPNSAPAGAHLTYYGGRVVSNMQVVQVLWGSGTFLPEVAGTGTPSMATFYQQVLNSPYVDMFSEYNTTITAANGSPGTNQTIGRGSFSRQVTIAPSTSATTIDDSTIQSELAAQIQAGNLPAPAHDAAGNNNTYYAFFFPHGVTITQGGSSSCVSGGFCAYHGTVANVPGAGEVFYGVHPDMQSGSGCDTGCGSSTPFANYTSVASHEMSETITDCEVGLANGNAPPLAWYDSVNGENGDICNAQQATFSGTDGQTYTVQKEFSNAANDCIASSTATTANDFSVSVSPSSQSVNAGASVSYTVTTATTSGSAQTVSLSVSGLPAGVSGAFSPASVSSGQGSTLTLTASSSAASATATFTATGAAASGSHGATASLTVVGSSGGGGITNGDFETGSLSGWTAAGASESVVSAGCHGGTSCAQLGSPSPTSGDSSIAQTFTAPTGSTGITLWYKETCPDTVAYDWALATLTDNTSGTTATLIARTCTSNNWTNVNGAVTAGHSYTITLTSHDDNYAADPTYTLYDDVALTSSAPPPPVAGGVTNGGFETGTFSGWTTSGTTSISSTVHNSGAYGAVAGSASPTNGDSNIAQTFTAPSGTSTLSLYYANSCPDTVTYDWVTVTLTDNTSGTSTAVVPKTCASSYTWTNATAAVTAGHSYTLTLTNHDDNYSADPTYSVFDDVTLQ